MSGHAPTTAGAFGHPVQRTTFIDPSRAGSRWQQAGVGVAGIVLAVVLIVGQISVATTAGIQRNLHANVQNLRDGNKTMEQIVTKAAPTVALEDVIEEQKKTLGHTRKTMGLLNQEMAQIGATTDELSGTVSRMETASGQLSSGVAGMNSDTTAIVDLLGSLPGATERTHGKLERIGSDSKAINTELNTISGRLQGYGLPKARNVGGGQ